MVNFSQLFADSDQAILDATGDDALLDGVPVRGWFVAPWLEPKLGTMKAGIKNPEFTLPDASAQTATKGSVLNFEGADYSVIEIEPDGTDMTVLSLRA